jgi:RND family efflux transporter MFP subunit
MDDGPQQQPESPARSAGSPRRRHLRRLLPGLLLLVAAGVAAALIATRPQLEPAPPREKVWTARIATAEIGDVQPEIRVFGEIVAAREAELRAKVAGQVVWVADTLREGALVEAGDELLRIDPFDYEAAVREAEAALQEARARLRESAARIAAEQSQIEELRTQLAAARRDLQRKQELAQKDFVSDQAVDAARSEVSRLSQSLRSHESALAAEEARREQHEAALDRATIALERTRRDLADTSLHVPFAGTLAGVTTDIGKRLAVNEKVATLVDDRQMDAELQLTDEEFARLRAGPGGLTGRPVEIVWQPGGAGLVYAGHIERIGARIDAARGGVPVYARLDAQDEPLAIRPGAFVEVRLPDVVYADVARLPETALYDGRHVYAVVDGRTERRDVTVAGRAGGDVLLRGELAPGDEIVITRINEIGPGMRIEVRE